MPRHTRCRPIKQKCTREGYILRVASTPSAQHQNYRYAVLDLLVAEPTTMPMAGAYLQTSECCASCAPAPLIRSLVISNKIANYKYKKKRSEANTTHKHRRFRPCTRMQKSCLHKMCHFGTPFAKGMATYKLHCLTRSTLCADRAMRSATFETHNRKAISTHHKLPIHVRRVADQIWQTDAMMCLGQPLSAHGPHARRGRTCQVGAR